MSHSLTLLIAGTILEATNTVTGFAPDTLLMTSAYDAVYDEDLPGFLCIKTQFWDKGEGNVPAYIRRRTIDGDWIWLESKAVAFVSQPVPGITLEEVLVENEEVAKEINRVTRITAILVQGAEAAWLTEQRAAAASAATAQPNPSLSQESPEYQSLLSATGMQLPNDSASLQDGMQLQLPTASSNNESDSHRPAEGGEKKSFDPLAMMESVRQGVRLDLGITSLTVDEVKMVSLVLSGKLPVEHVVTIVLSAMKSGSGLRASLRQFKLDSERVSPRHGIHDGARAAVSPPQSAPRLPPPPIAVVNLAYSYIGNVGIEMLGEVLYKDGSQLKTIDLSFCGIEEKGLLSFARALARRKKKGIPPLRGLIVSGNAISERAAAELGTAISPATRDDRKGRKRHRPDNVRRNGYESETTGSDDDDEEEDEDDDFGMIRRKDKRDTKGSDQKARKCCNKNEGLQLLHVASASLTSEATARLLEGLGIHCPVRELNLSSNTFGAAGASVLVSFFETRSRGRGHAPMPFLDRLDMSNNNLGDVGTTQLTRAISKRSEMHLVDLKLSSNSIGSGGIETIMNKLLQHNLASLSLDKNSIGDHGCQLVAASLQSMRSLSRLNLGFNQIGSRGITSLMRSLIDCESITYLGLSGNILKISGAIALAFTLAQHPRLEELDLDNCCLSQAAQCHIVAGIISNRWVPMKRLRGCAVGPPMVAIGALKPYAATLSNEECFRIRKDQQMKTILQWMESNRVARQMGMPVDPEIAAAVGATSQESRFLTPDIVASVNDVHGTPSQNAYFRLLGWLSSIPFDDDELTALQKYFYDADGGEGDRGSDGYINLKLRGDLLAALDSEVADEIREEFPSLASKLRQSVGIDLDKFFLPPPWDAFEAMKGNIADIPPVDDSKRDCGDNSSDDEEVENMKMTDVGASTTDGEDGDKKMSAKHLSDSALSRTSKMKPRITMFPQFEQQLEELKATATEMIEMEEDTMQHEVILTQYAEASLTILRQLRYYCMNSGLDGWRHGGLKRKVLIIDDSTVTRKLVSRAFEKADFIVDTASNGAEGVEKLKASIYDIAFMDIDMPVMNGFEATKKLRDWEDKMRPGTRQPICALTAAYVDDFERSELMKFKEAGLDVMESKPCNIPRLFKVVDDVSPMFSDLSTSVIKRASSEYSE